VSTGGDDLELDYAALVDMIADVVYAIDLRGCFIYVNTAGEDVFGWRAQDLMGEHMTAVLAPDSVAATVEHFRRGVMDPARTPYFETTILRPDGTTRELEIHAGALYRDGRQVARQGVGRDITELKRLQSELANKTARLAMVEEQQRAAMELYRKFSLVATHMSRDPQASSGALDAVDEVLSSTMVKAFGLDEQDMPIIELVAQGYSNQEIADKVHLSVHTVKDRVSRIVAKLDARSRAGVALRASDAGLLRVAKPVAGDGRDTHSGGI